MSPLSDTTNLAPAMAGTDLFTHIRYMTITTVPSIILALTIFLIVGFSTDTLEQAAGISPVLNAIDSKFNITGWLFIVPVLVIVMIVRKVPALPALLIGSLLGAVFAIIFQPQVIAEIAGEGYTGIQATYVAVMKALYTDISVTTSNDMVNSLLSTGGMAGMLGTVWLIICAMTFGGAMESSGMLACIAGRIISSVKSTGSLISSTVGTCVFFNLTASDQYLAIVVPGRMYADTYRDRGLKPENLSRSLEDSGTVTSVLIPWNTCGATQASVLGVATAVYAPFCFFNIISPFMTILMGYVGFRIARLPEKQPVAEEVAASA
jgi:NhaC family Na+:H+ antiporter